MRKFKGLLGIIVGSFLLLHAGGNLAYADDHGNNGTLKVVSATDPGNDMDNDPKVCNFHLAGFKFDARSSGTWSISGQGGNAGSASASGSWSANANGDWQTANMTLAAGQYKASAKQTSPATSGGDKQKVFKVDCAEHTVNGTPAPNSPTPSPSQSAAGQPASMTGTGSKSKATGSKSKANGSATGTGSQSKNNSNGSKAATAGSVASANGATDNTASVSEHGGEQGSTATPTPTPTPTNNGGEQSATASPSPSAQGFVNVPGSQNGGNSGNNGQNTGGQNANTQNGAGAQGFSNLPSTSTDPGGALTALGALLVGFGAFLLRRPGRQPR